MGSLILEGDLGALSAQAQPFPAWLLGDAYSGLCLFSAAFQGINDAIHFVRAGIPTTCVDTDKAKIRAMRKVYPNDWEFVLDDAWKFADAAAQLHHSWDVVTADTFLGNATAKSMLSLELWCSIANQAVIATIPTTTRHTMRVDGWESTVMHRSSRASWLILTR